MAKLGAGRNDKHATTTLRRTALARISGAREVS
jgi:hypothetical protein